jgi:hypothetical protein
VKIKWDWPNNHRKGFEVRIPFATLWFPYALLEVRPRANDRVRRTWFDMAFAREAFSYELESGREGVVYIDQVLAYDERPDFLRDRLHHKLTLEAQRRVEASPLSKREIIRQMRTSASQFYRLLDEAYDRKSLDQLVSLLDLLGCEVDLVVRDRKD